MIFWLSSDVEFGSKFGRLKLCRVLPKSYLQIISSFLEMNMNLNLWNRWQMSLLMTFYQNRTKTESLAKHMIIKNTLSIWNLKQKKLLRCSMTMIIQKMRLRHVTIPTSIRKRSFIMFCVFLLIKNQVNQHFLLKIKLYRKIRISHGLTHICTFKKQ